jgi:hypothetical protein
MRRQSLNGRLLKHIFIDDGKTNRHTRGIAGQIHINKTATHHVLAVYKVSNAGSHDIIQAHYSDIRRLCYYYYTTTTA